MKKALIFTLALAFIATVAAPVFAFDLKASVDKASKGTMEVVKSPLVIYDHTKDTVDGHDYKAIGLFKGLIESPFHMVHKAGSGLLDVVTFPVK